MNRTILILVTALLIVLHCECVPVNLRARRQVDNDQQTQEETRDYYGEAVESEGIPLPGTDLAAHIPVSDDLLPLSGDDLVNEQGQGQTSKTQGQRHENEIIHQHVGAEPGIYNGSYSEQSDGIVYSESDLQEEGEEQSDLDLQPVHASDLGTQGQRGNQVNQNGDLTLHNDVEYHNPGEGDLETRDQHHGSVTNTTYISPTERTHGRRDLDQFYATESPVTRHFMLDGIDVNQPSLPTTARQTEHMPFLLDGDLENHEAETGPSNTPTTPVQVLPIVQTTPKIPVTSNSSFEHAGTGETIGEQSETGSRNLTSNPDHTSDGSSSAGGIANGEGTHDSSGHGEGTGQEGNGNSNPEGTEHESHENPEGGETQTSEPRVENGPIQGGGNIAILPDGDTSGEHIEGTDTEHAGDLDNGNHGAGTGEETGVDVPIDKGDDNEHSGADQPRHSQHPEGSAETTGAYATSPKLLIIPTPTRPSFNDTEASENTHDLSSLAHNQGHISIHEGGSDGEHEGTDEHKNATGPGEAGGGEESGPHVSQSPTAEGRGDLHEETGDNQDPDHAGSGGGDTGEGGEQGVHIISGEGHIESGSTGDNLGSSEGDKPDKEGEKDGRAKDTSATVTVTASWQILPTPTGLQPSTTPSLQPSSSTGIGSQSSGIFTKTTSLSSSRSLSSFSNSVSSLVDLETVSIEPEVVMISSVDYFYSDYFYSEDELSSTPHTTSTSLSPSITSTFSSFSTMTTSVMPTPSSLSSTMTYSTFATSLSSSSMTPTPSLPSTMTSVSASPSHSSASSLLIDSETSFSTMWSPTPSSWLSQQSTTLTSQLHSSSGQQSALSSSKYSSSSPIPEHVTKSDNDAYETELASSTASTYKIHTTTSKDLEHSTSESSIQPSLASTMLASSQTTTLSSETATVTNTASSTSSSSWLLPSSASATPTSSSSSIQSSSSTLVPSSPATTQPASQPIFVPLSTSTEEVSSQSFTSVSSSVSSTTSSATVSDTTPSSSSETSASGSYSSVSNTYTSVSETTSTSEAPPSTVTGTSPSEAVTVSTSEAVTRVSTTSEPRTFPPVTIPTRPPVVTLPQHSPTSDAAATEKPESSSSSTTSGNVPSHGSGPTLVITDSTEASPPYVYHTTSAPVGTTRPPVFIQISLRMSWEAFCSTKNIFIDDLQEIIHIQKQVFVNHEQFRIPNIPIQSCTDGSLLVLDEDSYSHITIDMYIVDMNGKINITLTTDASTVIEKGFQDSSSRFKDKIVTVRFQDRRPTVPDGNTDEEIQAERNDPDKSITLVIVIASVGGVCCVALVILQVVQLHRRVKAKKQRLYVVPGHQASLQSMDHVALGVIPKSRPNSGLWNPSLSTDSVSEPDEYSHIMTFSTLANFCMDSSAIHSEFQNIPFDNPNTTDIPGGEEDKNRFANVLPHGHSRVKLQPQKGVSDYINANYVDGYMGEKRVYIATQSPLVNTVDDFWRMIWEQQSRVILMLNAVGPNGKPKQSTCYWPDNFQTDSRREFSDYVITLKKRDVQHDYIDCTLEILDIEKNLKREIHHFMMTCWSDTGTPEPLTFVKFVLDTRPHYENTGKPVVIHCGPGTGRSGALMAVDLCMRMFEDTRRVDILNCVHKLRTERAGAVQTKEQYMLIYQALNEYAVIVSSPSISTRSSVITLHAML